MQVIRSAVLTVCALAVAILPRTAAEAQESAAQYPSRPITFVVPFAPGGVTGLFARILGQKLEQRLGKPFIIDHKPGGGGVTGAVSVARAAPDGYTVMMASSSILAFNATVRKELAYDPRKDLTPIALLARVPFVLVVNPALPVNSVADLVKLAKEKPGLLSFATPGPGTFHHLNSEIFKSMFGLDLVHVPYKGTAPAIQDVAAGHVTFMFADVPPARGLIEGSKVRALGVTTKERVKAMPEVPALAEGGIPGYDTASWHTITTTGGVPKEIIDKLASEVRAVMGEPEVQKLLSDDGAIPQISPSPEEMKTFVASEIVRWGEVITKAGIAGSQ
ncbi:MAG: tripartite tricarboxylate transporter substrate binding protein [Alphaproteobacteria bacterium]|nr:tripartite tricarboxylate transporter substrate binding protein [Alphaproteobacteria bacterium]